MRGTHLNTKMINLCIYRTSNREELRMTFLYLLQETTSWMKGFTLKETSLMPYLKTH